MGGELNWLKVEFNGGVLFDYWDLQVTSTKVTDMSHCFYNSYVYSGNFRFESRQGRRLF